MVANPILARELSLVFHRRGALARLLLFAGAAAAAVYVVWPREMKLLIYREQISQLVFSVFGTVLRALTLLFAPAWAALSVTRDREQGSLETICSASYSVRRIYRGKIVAGACYQWLLIASTMPMAAMVYLLGGIALWEVLAEYLALFLMSAAIVAYGVSCSTRAPNSAAALARTYSHVLPIGVVWLILPELHPVWIAAPLVALRWIVGHRPSLRHLQYPADQVMEIIGERHKDRLADAGDWFDWLFGRRAPKRSMRDWANPVLVRELRCEGLGGPVWVRGTLLTMLGLSLAAAVLFVWVRDLTPLWYLSVIGAIVLVVPALSAPAFTREFDQGTFDSLVVTTLRPATILLGKTAVGIRTGVLLTLALTAVGAPILVWLRGRNTLYLLPPAFVVIGSTLLLLSVSGVFFSLASKSTASALTAAYGVAVAAFAGGPLALWLMGVFTDLPPARYAWVALASPATPFLAMAEAPFTRDATALFGSDGLVYGYAGLCAGLSLLLFIVMAFGFDYFWKKGPLRRW